MASHGPAQDAPKTPGIMVTDPFSSSSSSSDDSSPRSSDSSSDSSPPSTPPSPAPAPAQPLPVLQHAPHSSNRPKRAPRRGHTPTARLGAIDEDSNQISPDVPLRNPRRLLYGIGGGAHSRLFNLAFSSPALASSRRAPPENPYDHMTGPHGEKFANVRENKRQNMPGRGGWKRLVCLGCVIILIAAVVVGLTVGLTRKKANRNQLQDLPSNSPSSDEQKFPVGSYAITTYLTTVSTSCTPNSATWRCYPHQIYSQSVSLSISTLNWIIAAESGEDSTYTISSSDPTFSYPFINASLTLQNTSASDDQAYVFTYLWTKVVIPSSALTSDGAATRCYFNDTLLTGRLFTRKQKATALLSSNSNDTSASTSTSDGAIKDWPFALEFEETMSAEPECYRFTNGVAGERVDIGTVTDAETGCECGYVNYGV